MQGDEEEDGIDDLENEFNFDARTKQDMHHALAADAMLHYGRASDSDLPHVIHSTPQVPLLTNGQMVSPTRSIPILTLNCFSPFRLFFN